MILQKEETTNRWLSVMAVFLLMCSVDGCNPKENDENQGTSGPSVDQNKNHKGPEPRKPTFLLQPGDLATSVGTSPLRLVVSGLANTIDDKMALDLSSRLSLATYPEGVLEKTQTKVDKSPSFVGYGVSAVIDLISQQALSSRWYVMRFDPPAGTFTSGIDSNATLDANGSHLMRFHTGSFPVFRMATVCKSTKPYDANTKVISLSFSEIVTATKSVDNVIQVSTGGKVASCIDESQKVVSSNSKLAGSYSFVRLYCNGIADSASTSINISTGFESLAGQKIVSISGKQQLSLNLKPVAGLAAADACQSVYVE